MVVGGVEDEGDKGKGVVERVVVVVIKGDVLIVVVVI